MSSHFPAISSEELVKFFVKRGFVKKSQKGSHIRLKKPGVKRALIITANKKEVSLNVISSNLKTAGISRDQFISAIQNSKAK